MKCFVISLATSAERRSSIEHQLSAFNIDYSFFDAIDMRRERNRYFHHCDADAFQMQTGRPPSAGEIGCYASHLMLWRTCQLLNEPIAIFEDDAMFGPGAAAGLDLAKNHVRRLGFVRLQQNNERLSVPVVRQGRYSIDYCLRYPYGSTAYVLSPAVAGAFIRESRVFAAPVDRFIKDFWRHGQPLYALDPEIVRGATHSSLTTLPGRDRVPQGSTLRMQRWVRKRVDFVRRAQFNAVQLFRHSEALYRHAEWRIEIAALLR